MRAEQVNKASFNLIRSTVRLRRLLVMSSREHGEREGAIVQ